MKTHTIALLSNASAHSGVGKYASEIQRAIKALHEPPSDIVAYHIDGEARELKREAETLLKVNTLPGILKSKSISWIRLGKKYMRYANSHPHALYHLTNQTLSFLAAHLHPSIVTVHDIIELHEPQQMAGRWINRYLLSGIPKAAHIISVSEYTKQTLQEYFDIPDDHITVIPNGVGSEYFPTENFERTVAAQILRQKLKLTKDHRVVLYVGSEHPRKNLPVAIEAFAQVQKNMRNTVFVKVGDPGIMEGRQKFFDSIDRHKVRDTVRIVNGGITSQELNEYYNLANILIHPSKLEGFGLQVLEAMAAGTPVVASNATSIPEVAGDAAILHDPNDAQAFASSIEKLLTDTVLSDTLASRGLARAQQFTWHKAAQQTLAVYNQCV